MATLYKGYAQQKGFGAYQVKVQDPAEKIRRQGLEAMKGMEEQINWNNKQATRLINSLEENARVEEQNRRNNFELRSLYATTVQQQKQRNYEDLVRNARNKQAAAEKDIKNLLSLTKSGTALYKAFDDKRKKDADLWAHQWKAETGLGWEELQGLQGITEESWQDSAQREVLLQKMGLDGTPDDVIDRLRNVSGYRAIALAKIHARSWAMDTSLYYADNFNTKVELAGVEMDLSSAKGAQVHDVLDLLDRKRREEDPNAPSAKMLGLVGGYDIMDKSRSQQIYTKTRQAQQDAINRQWDDEITLLKDHIGSGPDGMAFVGPGVEKLIKYYAGGESATRETMRSARHRVVSAIVHGLKTNQIDWEDIRHLENHPMTIGGATKSFSDFFEQEWLSIEAAGVESYKTASARAQLGQKQTQLKDQEFLSELHQLARENPSPEVWGKMLAIARAPQNNYSESAKFITDVMVRGQNGANDAEGMATAKGWITRGEHVTKEMIQNLKVTPGMQAQIEAEVAKHNKFLPTTGDTGTSKRLEATVDGLLKHLIPATVLDDNSDVRLGARHEALLVARNQYKAYTASGMSHEQALVETQKFIRDKILDKDGLWSVTVDKVTGQQVFSGFHADGDWVKIDVDDNGGLVKFANNHNLMYSMPLIDRDALEKKSIALNNGQQQDILTRATFLESAIGHTPNAPKALAIEMAQIEYHNDKVEQTGKGTKIAPYPDWYVNGISDTYNRFSPRAQRLLNNWGYCDINRAACESQLNPVYNKPVVEQAQGILSEDSDYNRTDKGNSLKKLGFDISTRSIRDIITLQEGEKFLLAGRYGFDRESLAEAVELAGLSINDKFTPVIQDKLFEAYFKVNGEKLIGGVVDMQERLLLESAYRLLTEEKLGPLGMNEPALLHPQAFKAKFDGGFYG